MRRVNHEKSKLIGTILFLLTFFVGIGYAALTEQISVDQAINFGTMKWDVGFISAADLNGTAPSVSTISSDKTTLNIDCNISSTTEAQTCLISATIKNSGTFNVELKLEPITEYDSEFIESITVKYQFHNTDMNPMEVGDAIFTGQEEKIIIRVTTKDITETMLDEINGTLSIKVRLNWTEHTPRETITFKIENQTYQAEKNMTWEQWIYSNYNISNNYKYTNSRNCNYNISSDAGAPLINAQTSKRINCNDLITNNGNYTYDISDFQ